MDTAAICRTDTVVQGASEPLRPMSSPTYEAEKFSFGSPSKRQKKRTNEGFHDSARGTEKRCRLQQDTQESSDRMACPFYARNPKHNEIKQSCFNKGFAEIAKLRDHLKSVHQISKKLQQQLNFRGEPFRSLKDKEAKWRRAFQILFPEIPKDKIPSSRLGSTYSGIEEITLDFNALGHLLENQCWVEYGAETTVPTVEFMQRLNHLFVDVTKMWLGLHSADPNGIPTSVRYFQTILEDLNHLKGTTSDFAPYSLDDFDPRTPSESSITVGNETCRSQVLTEDDEKQSLVSPTAEYIKSDESCSESQVTEPFTPPESPENTSFAGALDNTLENTKSPIILKLEPHELTLADCPTFPPDTSSFNSTDALTQSGDDLFDFSTFCSSSCYETKLPDGSFETDVDVSTTMEDSTEIYRDDCASFNLTWSTFELDSSWLDSTDFSTMFT